MSDQQIATQSDNTALLAAGVSSVKTVKTSKKVTSSSKKSSTSTKKTTVTTTGEDGVPVSSSDVSKTSTQEQKSAAATATTATKTTAMATGEVQTETSSASSAVMSASRSVMIQKSGQTYSQHMASISSGLSEEQQGEIDLKSLKAALANASPNLQIQELVLDSSGQQQATLLKPEDFTDKKDGSKAALLTFNISEFESQTLEVVTDGNKVHVQAKKKHVNPEGEERSEQFSRVYELPTTEPVNPALITTSVYQDGVLTIELPVGSDVMVVMEGEEAKPE